MLTFEEVSDIGIVLALSCITATPVEINSKITPQATAAANAINSIVSGSKLTIDKYQKWLKYIPGIILGGPSEVDLGEHLCSSLISICLCGLFGKTDLEMFIHGVTNQDDEVSVDAISNVLPIIFSKFNLPSNSVSIKILKRGFLGAGGGKVQVKVRKTISLDNCYWVNEGLVKRIRGICYASKVSVNVIGRTIGSCREIFNDYIPDVWVASEYAKAVDAALTPGYGLCLVAETNSGCHLTAELCATNIHSPEEVGKQASLQLLDEVHNSGVVDTSLQGVVLILMALAGGKPSVCKLGRISPYT